jgi:WD40 repeat protein
VAFSGDGKILASASADTTVILWDVSRPASPRQLAVLRGHSGPVFDASLSPDGRMLASSSGDKSIILWDISDPASPRQLAILQGHSDAVYDTAFAPGGDMLASGGNDRTVILWNMNPVSLAQRACEIVGRNFTGSEWSQYFAGEPYHSTCDQWPAGE